MDGIAKVPTAVVKRRIRRGSFIGKNDTENRKSDKSGQDRSRQKNPQKEFVVLSRRLEALIAIRELVSIYPIPGLASDVCISSANGQPNTMKLRSQIEEFSSMTSK